MSERGQAPAWVNAVGWVLALGATGAYLWWVTYGWAWKQHGLLAAVGSVVLGLPVLEIVVPLAVAILLSPLALASSRKATP